MIVCLDSNIVIYHVERDQQWVHKVASRLNSFVSNGHNIAISDACRLECMVGPIKNGDTQLINSYTNYFADPAVQVLPTPSAVWEKAAELRAKYKFQAMDSVHLASAIEHGCGLFFTQDAALAKCKEIPVEVLK
jgi:uncharacterized protein